MLYGDSYGDAPRYLQGPVVDRMTFAVEKAAAGDIESLELVVHLSEKIRGESVAQGARLRGVDSNGNVLSECSVEPLLDPDDPSTIRWTLGAFDWHMLTQSGGVEAIEIAITNTLRADGWGATPVSAPPEWARALFGTTSTATEPIVHRESVSTLDAFIADTPTETRRESKLYAIEDLYLATTAESKSKLLTGFHAYPFVEPANGKVYARARWYDPQTGTFMSPDPMGYHDSSNLYAGFANDPVNNSDPRGTYVESAWDVASLGLGLYQISQWDENTSFWTKTLDVVGVGVDTAALVLPLVPGGVGAGLKAYRAGDTLHDAYLLGSSVDRLLDTAQGVDQAFNTIQAAGNIGEAYENRDVFGLGLNTLQLGLGMRSLSTRGVGGFRLTVGTDSRTLQSNGLAGLGVAKSSKGTLPDWLRERFRAGEEFNRVNRPRYAFNEVEVADATGRVFRVDSYDPVAREIVSRRLTQLDGVTERSAISYFQEFTRKYPEGATITHSPFNPAILRGQRLQGDLIFEVPVQTGPIPRAVIQAAAQRGIRIRDVLGTVYR